MRCSAFFGMLTAASLAPAVASAATPSGKWRLASLEDTPSFDASKTELAFLDAGRAAMTVGCNRMSASASVSGTALKFGPIMATKMACPPRLMALEASFQNAIGRTVTFKLDGDKLTLIDASASIVATFTRQQ